MKKFKKMVVIEKINVSPDTFDKLGDYAEEVVVHTDIPDSDEEIGKRIGDADCALISYTSVLKGEVIRKCPNLKYVGMCCSLYDPKAANVDIITANELGIEVRGVRDYGDEGVPEYVISELVRLLHGFGDLMWKDVPLELTNIPIGVVGLGVSGTFVAKALKYFGADVHYYSRTRKEDLEKSEGFVYNEFHDLLKQCDIICTCLNKNVILLNEEEFKILGNGKIVINTSIAPSHDLDAALNWLNASDDNYLMSDSAAGVGSDALLSHKHVTCGGKNAGTTSLSQIRLSQKVLKNMEDFLS